MKNWFKKSKWLKIEHKNNGPWSWTEYTDYNGKVYTIYNLMLDPGFSNAYLQNTKS